MKRITKRFTTVLLLFFVLVYNLTTYFYTFSEYVSRVDATNTGINSNVVTINDLEADYNYYMGLNYVSSDGTLPTLENKNLYNENNLVELKITYFGKDISNENVGYVSLNEKQDTLVLARKHLGQLKKHTLSKVCEFFGVPLLGAHRAVNDTVATAKIFLKLIENYEKTLD